MIRPGRAKRACVPRLDACVCLLCTCAFILSAGSFYLRYWLLPDGRAVNFSAIELVGKKADAFVTPGAHEAYFLVGKELLYEPLGLLQESELERFRESPGTLEERLWKRYRWGLPPDEITPCWWVSNLDSEDQSVEVKLVFRSLNSLRIDLCTSRLATTAKLRSEWDRRLAMHMCSSSRLHV